MMVFAIMMWISFYILLWTELSRKLFRIHTGLKLCNIIWGSYEKLLGFWFSPPNHKIIGSKLVYKLKFKSNGLIERYKARLVAKGYDQVLGLDYFETFSTTVKPTKIMIVITLVISCGWCLKQLDVHNTLLNNDIMEQVYKEQPQVFVNSTQPTFVFKLTKALYGLKQYPKDWFTKLSLYLLQWDFTTFKTDSSMSVLVTSSAMVASLIYASYIIIVGSNIILLDKFITSLNIEVSLKVLALSLISLVLMYIDRVPPFI